MNEIDDGGPAFPTREKIGEEFNDYTGTYRDVFGTFGGMTLRDNFAAKAMLGFLAGFYSEQANKDPEVCAEWAYEQADAMLAARSKK